MNRAIWTANTYGPKPTNHRCLMQGDGNLVIYGGPQQKALWASQSQNKGGSRLVVQDDGNVVIYTKDFRPIYDTKTSVALSSGVNTSAPDSPTAPPPHKTDVLPYSPTSGAVAIFELKFGDELRSANGTFALKFQPDGNLVLYVESKSEYARLMNRAIWNADSANRGGTRCLMGRDGNLDIIDARGGVVKPIFTAPGLGHLVMQDDGNVVLYNVGNEFRWQTRTSVDETPGANV